MSRTAVGALAPKPTIDEIIAGMAALVKALDVAAEIRERAKTERRIDLAVEYGVSAHQIGVVASGKQWRNV